MMNDTLHLSKLETQKDRLSLQRTKLSTNMRHINILDLALGSSRLGSSPNSLCDSGQVT